MAFFEGNEEVFDLGDCVATNGYSAAGDGRLIGVVIHVSSGLIEWLCFDAKTGEGYGAMIQFPAFLRPICQKEKQRLIETLQRLEQVSVGK